MKVIATLAADFSQSPLGLPSRLEESIQGETVVRRTIKRVLRCADIESVHLVVPVAQLAQAQSAAANLDVNVETHDAASVPWHELMTSARKWAMNNWRGGLAGMTVFDETINPWVLNALAQRENADAVVDIPAAAALVDPQLLDQIIGHYTEIQNDIRLSFTQAPPGLSAVLLQQSLLKDLVQSSQSLGRIMAYHPTEPTRDMVMQSCFYSTDAAIMHAQGRCLADTGSGIQRLNALLTADAEDRWSAQRIASWLKQQSAEHVDPLPAEVEIELTTHDPLPRTQLRPRGAVVPERGPMDVALFKRLIDELASRDDVLVVLGGFGDPLLHPDWPELVAYARQASIFGLAIRTTGLAIDDQAAMTLCEHKVDVLNVLLDAHSAETYQRVHSDDRFDEVLANINRISQAHQAVQIPQPMIVPELLKTSDTLNDMEAFYDTWLLRTGTAVIAGPSHYARQFHDLNIMNMAPPSRLPCRRLNARAMILADGRITRCDQDFKGQFTFGDLHHDRLSPLWTGTSLQHLRLAHGKQTFSEIGLCADCDEWHRP